MPSFGLIANNILELIGRTPVVRLDKIVSKDSAKILAKLESFNPGGSIKDRICLFMIRDAEKKGILKPKATIIEPTSGNTGIGLAMLCAIKGYRCVLVMPKSVSKEKIHLLKIYGADVILTPSREGMQGAIKKAKELLSKIPNSFMPKQFNNPLNPEAHRQTTAKEIISMGIKIDAFIAGIGTGGTITGVGEILKRKNPEIKIFAVEPKRSAVLSGRKPGVHNIQGIGAGFIPEILNKKIIDGIMKVDDKEAFDTLKKLARKEGLFVGPSSGAVVFAALKIAKLLGTDKTVLTILPDGGERYLSLIR